MKNPVRSLLVLSALALGIAAYAQSAASNNVSAQPAVTGQNDQASAMNAADNITNFKTDLLVFKDDVLLSDGSLANILIVPNDIAAKAKNSMAPRFVSQDNVSYTPLPPASAATFVAANNQLVQEHMNKLGQSATTTHTTVALTRPPTKLGQTEKSTASNAAAAGAVGNGGS